MIQTQKRSAKNGLSVDTPVSKQVWKGGKRYERLVKPYKIRLRYLRSDPRDTKMLAYAPSEQEKEPYYSVRIDEGFLWRPSVPNIFRGIMPIHPLYPASLVHDWMYRYRGNMMKEGYLKMRADIKSVNKNWYRIRRVSREFADGVFRKLMLETEVPTWRAQLAWAAVRIGGGFKWRSPYEGKS